MTDEEDQKHICYDDYLLYFGLFETYRFVINNQETDIYLRKKMLNRCYSYEMLKDIVGAQPMAGPIGSVFTMKVRYEKDNT